MTQVRRERPQDALIRPRSGLIGLTIPSLDEPYFAGLAARILERAPDFGQFVAILQTFDDADAERNAISGSGFPPVDGVLLVPRFVTAADLTRRRNPTPLVLLGEHVARSTFCHVTIDNRAAMREVTQHVIDTGRERVVMVGRRSSPASDAAEQRFLGFRDATGAAGVRGDVLDVSDFSSDAGVAAGQQLLSGELPDAVVCVNDSVALGVVSALQAAGHRVPDDVAVTGFDDIAQAAHVSPALTSITPDVDAMVTMALSLLERQIASPLTWTPDMDQVIVGHHLSVRRSTARR